MKQISVIGINLKTSKWIVTSSSDPLNDKSYLCALKCSTPVEAESIINSMNNAFKNMEDRESSDVMEEERQEPSTSLLSDYYLRVHGNYVVASMGLLEDLFDGKIENNQPTDDSSADVDYYIVKPDDVVAIQFERQSSFSIIINSTNKITLKRKNPMEEDEPDLIDFTDEYLGATLFKKNKTNAVQVKEAYSFDGLFFSEEKFYQILWLPAAPYKGMPMLTAYGCQNEKDAKKLEIKILHDAKTLTNKRKQSSNSTNDSTNANFTMQRKEAILLVSQNYLETIYGKPTLVPLVNDFAKQGLADKYAKQRETAISTIYKGWDKVSNDKNEKTINPENKQIFNFFGWVSTNVAPVKTQPLNRGDLAIKSGFTPVLFSKNTIVPRPEPLPYPLNFPVANQNQTIMSASGNPSAFNLSGLAPRHIGGNNLVSQTRSLPENEPFKEFSEEEYLSLFT